MKCKKCNTAFTPSKGLINYCSMFCRNSKVQTPEANRARSVKAKQFWRFLPQTERDAKIAELSKYHTKESLMKLRAKAHAKLIARPFEDICKDSKRKIVLVEQNGCCNKCGISEWMGQKITLEIDHKDGINDNDVRDNLEALCPNCHSLTPTWRGRNTKGPLQSRKTDAELLELFKISGNIHQTLLVAGMAAKGGNYKRMHRIINQDST